jgi:formylglycine-generating enzyme required for sulfatase activity
VSGFGLDAFEVTVGRFRSFVAHYPDSRPLDSSGANPKNRLDAGWQHGWTALLPATQEELLTQFDAEHCPTGATWTDAESASDELPINCVSWYVAQAFCIWDGGRLPTEAEWDYVAGGGTDRRVYPWADDVIDGTYTNYYYTTPGGAPLPVGSFPSGRGKWGHWDLAGNVSEWVWDGYQNCYIVPGSCVDCGVTDGYEKKVRKGGGYYDDQRGVSVVNRGGAVGTEIASWVGFRCARDL